MLEDKKLPLLPEIINAHKKFVGIKETNAKYAESPGIVLIVCLSVFYIIYYLFIICFYLTYSPILFFLTCLVFVMF
jgi:hypothetical protein